MHWRKLGTGATPLENNSQWIPMTHGRGPSGAGYQRGRGKAYQKVCLIALCVPISVHNKMCMDAQIFVHSGKRTPDSK
jgi:hypothetical protein